MRTSNLKKGWRYNPLKDTYFYVDYGFFLGKHTVDIQMEKDKDLHPEVRMIYLLLEIGNTIEKDIRQKRKL